MRNRRWALLAVLLVIMVAMSGCFGGRRATGGVRGVVYAPAEDSNLYKAGGKLLVKDLVFSPSDGYERLPGAVVRVEGTRISGTTDYKGHFQLTGIRVGTQTLTVSHELYKPVSIRVTILQDTIVSIPGNTLRLHGRGFYLLIGVGDFYYSAWESYGFGETDLEKMEAPKNDVSFLRNVLEYDNALVKGDIITLIDGQATYEEVRASLKSLVSAMEQDDYLVIYFSGHGASRAADFDYDAIALADGPVTDTKLREWVIEDLFAENYLDINDVTLILDTCYSGSFADGVETWYDDVFSQKAFRKPGYTVLASSRNDQESSYYNTHPQLSVFTDYLIYALETGRGDLDGDGLFTAQELYTYVGSETWQATNGKQNVYLWPSGSRNVIATYPSDY